MKGRVFLVSMSEDDHEILAKEARLRCIKPELLIKIVVQEKIQELAHREYDDGPMFPRMSSWSD